MNYYNEHDPKAAAWLRELIKSGEIPAGEVDERSICDVQPDYLRRFTQCHFFAGIAGLSYALKLAGWPSDRPVWTGSCPCQPFSTAGKQLGDKDERHLWPVFFRLIAQCRPVVVFGEQVASAIGKGWLDGVSADLESEGYACGAAVLGAHSVGGPHIRQRLYWVADANSNRRDQAWGSVTPSGCDGIVGNGEPFRMGYSVVAGLEGHSRHEHDGNKPGRIASNQAGSVAATSGTCGVANSDKLNDDRTGPGPSHDGGEFNGTESIQGFWSGFDLLRCTDGKARRIEPRTFPLAHGISGRVGLLRGYGNAIVPQVAAEFIQAFQEVT